MDPATGVHSQNIESLWYRAKKCVPAGCRQDGHFTTALAKFMFFNRVRGEGGDPFAAYLETVKTILHYISQLYNSK